MNAAPALARLTCTREAFSIALSVNANPPRMLAPLLCGGWCEIDSRARSNGRLCPTIRPLRSHAVRRNTPSTNSARVNSLMRLNAAYTLSVSTSPWVTAVGW